MFILANFELMIMNRTFLLLFGSMLLFSFGLGSLNEKLDLHRKCLTPYVIFTCFMHSK